MITLTPDERQQVQRTLLHTQGGKILLRFLDGMILQHTLADDEDRIEYNTVRKILNECGIGMVFVKAAEVPVAGDGLVPNTYDEQLGLPQEQGDKT